MKTFYRIAALGNRPNPQEFETVEAALDAAKEALKEFPGRVFEIYKCVAMVQYTEASTFWMDGEGPPEKPRYRMLEEGEKILPGDQFLSAGGIWKSHEYWLYQEFGGHVQPTRRPL